jgi:hypothetical protein
MKTNKRTVYLVLAIISLFMAGINQGFAQSSDDKYGDLVRPDNLGNADFDNFKNSCFDIYFNVGKLDENLKSVETNLVGYKKDKSNINFTSLKSDIKSLNEIGESLIKLQGETATLKNKSEQMVKDAKNFTPKLKAPKAISNTNKSVTALDQANDRTKVLIGNQKTALATAKELLGNN